MPGSSCAEKNRPQAGGGLMQTEILATLVALGGGGIGYLVREVLNRARPFFSIEVIDGRLQRSSDQVTIPAEVIRQLRDSLLVEVSDPTITMRDLDRTWDRADDIVRFWPKVQERLDAVLKAGTAEQLKRAIPKLVELRPFDDWLMLMLLTERVVF